ncbi:hypothetical protein [Deinococcus marmoris]|uniref:hypothetical protein n=1 Tax=Deinococcus marmoris TaxID=249408 RepID=UPI00049569AC|nr:hypothetical protein [Deinococcus marmoris]
MKTFYIARTVLLSASVCAALAGAGSGGASILLPDLADVIRQNDARHLARQDANMEPTLEQMLEPFNFTGAETVPYFVSQNAMSEQLEGRGLVKTGRYFAGNQQIDIWYSAAEDRSVVCVVEADGGQYTQAMYVMPSRIKRADLIPLP